jgi:hypothetical protein
MQLVNSILIQTPGPNGANPVTTNDGGAVVGWILGFGLALVAVVLITKPLVQVEAGTKRRHQDPALNPGQIQLEGLQESASAEQQALQDLDFDRELGIIEETDYNTLKERSSQKLAELDEQIATLQRQLTGRTLEKRPVKVVEKPAVSQVTQNSKAKTGDTDKIHIRAIVKEKLKCGECGAAFKPGDRFCRQCSAPLPVLCLNCGHEISEDDRFCAKCGAAVNT